MFLLNTQENLILVLCWYNVKSIITQVFSPSWHVEVILSFDFSPFVCDAVRISPPHSLASRKTMKTEVPCHSRYGTIKIPSRSKALSAEHRPKFCSPSLAMVTSPNVKILKRDVKQ
jgi:hypothetical protein